MENEEWEDRIMARVIALGVVIGVPAMFVMTVLLGMLAHVAIWQAAMVALLPAFFIGPYLGGLGAMGAASAKLDRGATATDARPVEHEEPPIAA